MSDRALEFAEERGLGEVSGSVRLGSKLALPDGARAPASLLLCSSGLWLVAATDRFHGCSLDLLTRADLRLRAGRVSDRLCFGQEALSIPAGRRHAVERLIALARLGPPGTSRAGLVPSRFVQAPDEFASTWLARELASGEVLICWLRGSNSQPVLSYLIGTSEAHPYLLVTERRAAIVTWSAVGDVSYAALHPAQAKLGTRAERVEIASEGQAFVSRHGDERACRDAFELLCMEAGRARLLEAARRLWLGRERASEDGARALALLDESAQRGSQRARFARLLASAEDDADAAPLPENALRHALDAGPLTPTALGDLWTSFRFSERAGSALVRGLIDLGAAGLPFALALERRIHDGPSADEATAQDELRLLRFAVETRLTNATCPDARDQAILGVLESGGLEADASPARPAAVRASLSDPQILGTLGHPLARGQASLVASAQRLIALHPEPDRTALSDYCEALDNREYPEAKNALDAARLAFSLPNLHAYISRGKKSIGLRGYEGKAPYLLLGSAHLDPSSPFRMSEAELFYAFGAEALHVKLGQARITSNEIWAGAFARTKGGVELVLGLLPLLKGVPLAASAAKLLERIPEPALRRALELLVHVERTQQRTPPHEDTTKASALSHLNEHLIAAHRLMQMSADRAGAALCGDLRAGLRALFLVRPDTQALLQAMAERDLVSVLLESEIEPALRADLIVRVAALIQFHASADYLSARAALTGVCE